MAFVTIEDLHGSMEVIVFENCYQASTSVLLEDEIVMIEGRLSIREEEQNVTIIASKITAFGEQSDVPASNRPSKLEIDITTLDEGQKEKLRGAIHFFTGDKNNIALEIVSGERKDPAGAMYVTPEIQEQIEEIVGKERVKVV